MSYAALYSRPDAEPVEGDGIASTTGWWNWTNAVLARAPFHPELAHLANHGWSDRFDTLEHELEGLLHATPDEDLAPITANVLAAVRARPADAAALLVTDGEPADDEEEDEVEEGISESEYELLSEADRSGLTKKVITNKLGKQQTVWVRTDTATGADRRARSGGSEDVIDRAFREPKSLTREQVKSLTDHIAKLPKERLRQLALAAKQRIGPTKAAIADRLLASVRAAKKDAAPKKPKEPKRDAKTDAATKALADATETAAKAPTWANVKALGVAAANTSGSILDGYIGFLDRASADGGSVRAHGMATAEPTRKVVIDGLPIHYPDTPEGKQSAGLSLAGLANEAHPKLLAATKRIVISTGRSKDDPYWEQEYQTPDFKSTATGGDGTIVGYNLNSVHYDVFGHEAGHNLATQLWGSTSPDPQSEYGRAQVQEQPVTSYGAKSPSEDFAEAVKLYTSGENNRAELRTAFPLKYAALEKLLGAYP